MSQRNTLQAKRERRIRRSIVKGRLPAYVNLIEWIKMRSSVTTNEAGRLLLAGTLRVDSHPVGYVERDGMRFVSPLIPAEFRDRIEIHRPTREG